MGGSIIYYERIICMDIKSKTRIESDLLGERELNDEHLYGVQTLRGLENFQISPFKLNHYPHFVRGLAMTKMAAARANEALGVIQHECAKAIQQACQEIMEGKHLEHFPVDMIQGGAGTTTNMNANEVIANRALEIMGHEHGHYRYCSPNDHVNVSQSTNDAYPTAIHLGLYGTHLQFVTHVQQLVEAFEEKGKEFDHILKMGRTQLQDAVPMTLGQTFHGFASILREELPNLEHAATQLLTINMGATAIGTGICSEPGYREKCTEALRDITGWDIHSSGDLVAATSDTSHMIGYHGALKKLAVKLSKISNDLRLLSSGPRCGLGEIRLPAMQPGSSIMPGKVNPVIPEVMSQIAYKVIGNDVCVTLAGEASQLELNAMEPIMAQCCFESASYLMSGMDTLRERCIIGIEANEENCRKHVQESLGVVTALNPFIGYKNATKVAKEAVATGKSISEIVIEKGLLTQEELNKILSPENMIRPVLLDIKPREDKGYDQ